MKYHITIINNETQQVLLDEDTSVILGGVTVEDGTCHIAVAHASRLDIALAVVTCRRTIRTALRDMPKVRKYLGKARKILRRATKVWSEVNGDG